MILDIVADDTVTIEIQQEAGLPGHYKLYVHRNGETAVRVCKLKADHITIDDVLFTDEKFAVLVHAGSGGAIKQEQILVECAIHHVQYKLNELCQLCGEDGAQSVRKLLEDKPSYGPDPETPSDFERKELR